MVFSFTDLTAPRAVHRGNMGAAHQLFNAGVASIEASLRTSDAEYGAARQAVTKEGDEHVSEKQAAIESTRGALATLRSAGDALFKGYPSS